MNCIQKEFIEKNNYGKFHGKIIQITKLLQVDFQFGGKIVDLCQTKTVEKCDIIVFGVRALVKLHIGYYF